MPIGKEQGIKCPCGRALFRWTSPDDVVPARDGKITEASFCCVCCGRVGTTVAR